MPAPVVWQLHQMAGQAEGHLQDRRFSQSGSTLGQKEEQARHELRQAQQVHPPILQEGHHEENGKVTKAGLPVLPSVPSLTKTLVHKPGLFVAGLQQVLACHISAMYYRLLTL